MTAKILTVLGEHQLLRTAIDIGEDALTRTLLSLGITAEDIITVSVQTLELSGSAKWLHVITLIYRDQDT